MNYIYDILLNFKEDLYDFFDWNYSDDIEHIRKIPVFRIDCHSFKQIKENIVKFDLDFLNKLLNKTEVFDHKKVKQVEYAFLLSNGLEVLAFKCDDKGISKYISKLLIDEDTEVIEVCERLSEEKINYKNLNKRNIDTFKTRNDKDIIKYIKRELNVLIKNQEYDKLKYIYYECFNEKENKVNNIVKRINNCMDNNLNFKYIKMYNILKMKAIKR